MNKPTTVLLCGVGGQGTILAADVLARAALAAGYVVKVSEIHGMAQRGGSVTTVVRFGEQVGSMVCDLGSADVVVSFETTEALRNLPYLSEHGRMIVADDEIKPLTVATGAAQMPHAAKERLEQHGALIVPATALAKRAGTAKASNIVLLGALANYLEIPHQRWQDVIASRVPPKTIDSNLNAFRYGVEFS